MIPGYRPTATLSLLLAAVPGAALSQDACPAPDRLTTDLAPPLAHVRYLADDALQGREVGTPGAACAAEYLAARFAELGLQGAGPGGSFFQEFTVTVGSALGSDNRLVVAGDTYTLGEDWIPYGFSGSDQVEGGLLHGGLGMRGQILITDAPDPDAPQAGAMEGDPHFLAAAAARHGTTALVVLLPDGAPLPDPASESRPSVPIPVIAVAGDARDRISQAADRMDQASLSTQVAPAQRQARNVVALLEGADPALSHEVVVVGAHFDHLGLGGQGSLAPDSDGTIHNGADDNASGTAAMLEVAAHMAAAPEPPARSVLFMGFAGEEKGLWGSAHYVENPLLPLDGTVAMLNMDMVGRLGDGALAVFGVATAEEWEDVIQEANAELASPLELSLLPDGFGPSDHSSFYGEGVPVLHFFTNAHADYHRPSDDWDLIDEEGLVRVTGLVTGVTRRLAGSGGTAVAMTPVEGAGTPHGGGVPSGDGDQAAAASSGYGPYLGTIPDMTPRESGVRLTGVREGSPAEAAGMQSGDVIVEFAGREITDLYAYTYALRDHAPGDEVEIVVERDGERVTLTAVLGRR